MRTRDLALVFSFLGAMQASAIPLKAFAAAAKPAKAQPASTKTSATATAKKDPFAHLGGIDERIKEMKHSVLLPLFHPEVYEMLTGASAHGGPPSGVLVKGVPSSGKSELAKATRDAVNAEGGVALMRDATGINAATINAIFTTAIKVAKGIDPNAEEGSPEAMANPENAKPVALIFDEVHRLSGPNGDKRSEAVAMFNAKMDEIKGELASNPKMKRISVIGVTSEPGQVDASLTRKGKLEVPVEIEMPEEHERLDILHKLTMGHKLKSTTTALFAKIAKKTPGYTAGDLAKMTRRSAFLAALRVNPTADESTLTEALLKSVEIHPADIERAMKDTQPESAAVYGARANEVELDDVVGQPQAREQMDELINMLENPHPGDKLERIYVFVGPPGVGKTMMAAAVATKLGRPLFTLGTEVKNKNVGDTEGGIKAALDGADQANGLLLIDEAEGLLKARGSNPGDPTHDNGVDIVLAHSDSVKQKKKGRAIILIATNHPEMLDPAIYDPNGGGRGVVVPFRALSRKETELQYAKLLAKVDVESDVTAAKLAALTDGIAGRAVDKVMSQAWAIARNRGVAKVSMADYKKAVQRVRLDPGAPMANAASPAASQQRMLGVEIK